MTKLTILQRRNKGYFGQKQRKTAFGNSPIMPCACRAIVWSERTSTVDWDIVLVKKQSTAQNGDRVVVLVDNNEATFKKFCIALRAFNVMMYPA